MLDFSWQELALTGVVALVVIGPKELPGLMHTAGKMVRRARLVAHEFRVSFDHMAEEVEIEEYRKEALKKATEHPLPSPSPRVEEEKPVEHD